MFAHFLANHKAKSRPAAIEINNNNPPQVSSKNNYFNGRNNSTADGEQVDCEGGGGGFSWSASVWNLWSTTANSRNHHRRRYYKDKVQRDRHYDQQRSKLIAPENGGLPMEIEMDFLDKNNHRHLVDAAPPATPPPMSPSMFILPRCLEEQCYSPVKLVAGPERMSLRKIKFRSEDSAGSLIEKFDRITIMSCGGDDDKENKVRKSARSGSKDRGEGVQVHYDHN